MAEPRVIAAVGELVQVRDGGEARAGGLAAEASTYAAKLGHRAIAISRVGQDAAGQDLLRHLLLAGVNTEHVQTDPDHPTGRLSVRSIAGRERRTLDAFAAFDNLQWDFDLADAAPEAEAVVYGVLARRNAQARSTIDRFLSECRQGLKVFDLTNREEGADLPRQATLQGLRYADAAVLDEPSMRHVMPSAGNEPRAKVLGSILRRHELAFLLWRGAEGSWEAHDGDGSTSAPEPLEEGRATSAALAGVLHGVLAGWGWSRSLRASVRFAGMAETASREEITADLQADQA